MCHPLRLPNSSIILNFRRYIFLSCISANFEHRKKCCRSRQCLLTSMPFSRRSSDRLIARGSVFTGRYISHIIFASFSNCFKRLIAEGAVTRRANGQNYSCIYLFWGKKLCRHSLEPLMHAHHTNTLFMCCFRLRRLLFCCLCFFVVYIFK